MFIAMNRFKVAPGSEAAFEHVWTSRETHLQSVPGFVEFHLLRGPARDDHVLYSSHTIWADRDAFEAWTRSEGRWCMDAVQDCNGMLLIGGDCAKLMACRSSTTLPAVIISRKLAIASATGLPTRWD
jgi:quinol monooxygenase YgiN